MAHDGYVIVASPDKVYMEADSGICPHCGMPWFKVKGSGRLHRYCKKCGATTCSNLQCVMECYPYEKQMDDVEANKNVAELNRLGWQRPVPEPKGNQVSMIVLP